ncbi:MAG: nitroreductase [Chloroflexia bacterium]|nr:nitroreductase [Chloroflexia bacterium]
MNTLEAIAARRSIRRFKDTPVPDEMIHTVLRAAIQAPSGKNRQPWRFVVVREDKRDDMVRIMREGIDRVEELGHGLGSSRWTAKIMAHAPVTIFVFNDAQEHTPGNLMWDEPGDVVDVQSIGAAIQNILLAAQEIGLGTLWIGDVFYAYDRIIEWLGEGHQMIAAVSIGYPDEQPGPRPRKAFDEVVRWLD